MYVLTYTVRNSNQSTWLKNYTFILFVEENTIEMKHFTEQNKKWLPVAMTCYYCLGNLCINNIFYVLLFLKLATYHGA